MRVRHYIQSDFNDIKAWMRTHGLPDPNESYWPEIKLVVEDNNRLICAGFLYKTDSNTAIIEGIVRNPHVYKSVTDNAITLLIEELSEIAKNFGFKHVFSFTPHIKLVEKYEKCGFSRVHNNAVTLNRSL